MTNSVGGIVSMQKKRESCRGQKKGQNVKEANGNRFSSHG